MNTGIDWLRRQPLSTRLIMSAAFASLSVFAYFMGRIWPWGIIMATIPLIIGKRSGVEDEFFRETKETGEAPPIAFRRELKHAELEPLLSRLSAATTSGFGVDKLKGLLDRAHSMSQGEEKRFQYVVLFSSRPTSLQLTVRRKSDENFELVALGDAAFIEKI